MLEKSEIKKEEQKEATDMDSIIFFKIKNRAENAITMLNKPEFKEPLDKFEINLHEAEIILKDKELSPILELQKPT